MSVLRRLVPLALAAVALVPGPARADAAGVPCRFQLLGSLSEDPTGRIGVMTAGPWTATTVASRVSIACWVQSGDRTYRWPWTWPITSTTDGPAGVLAGVYTYNQTSPNAYVCTRVDYLDATGWHAVYVDDDPGTTGHQCRPLSAAG